MSTLDDFLEPLHKGVWEVTVPKVSVTQPLDPGWKRSAINVPTPGTIASYRKGRYHVHETTSEWKVHLDRYDPKVRPVMHLVDDAPLIFMIVATFVALVDDVWKKDAGDTGAILEGQKTAWQMLVLFGFAVMTAGIFTVLDPLSSFKSIIHLLVPLVFVILGVLIAGEGIQAGSFRVVSLRRLLYGIAVVFIGFVSYIFEVKIWGVVIFVLITFWGLGSAIMALGRVSHGRNAVPDGFYKWLVIGILSLLLAVLLFVTPAASIALLTMILGVVTLLAGLALVVNGFRLRIRTRDR